MGNSWGATGLIARDLGFRVVDGQALRWPEDTDRSGCGRKAGTAVRVVEADLASLRIENEWLTKTCQDYVEALCRAGTAIGLGGRVVVSECSGVVLQALPTGARGAGPAADYRRLKAVKPGLVLSLDAAGLNPVGLALDQAGLALLPPPAGPEAPDAVTPPARLHGLGAPLGGDGVPAGCLGVLLPARPQPGAQALLGQALFSARAINLALALRQERASNLEAAAGLAHEVRNPLTAVKGFLELTLNQRTRVPDYWRLALRELDRAIGLLEDYSLFSRAPKIAPTQAVSVDGLLSEAALLARGMAAAGPPVTVAHVESDPDLVVLAEPQRLKQVLLNLCRNAVEAMRQGGLLTLRARREGGEVVVEVADTGVGIPPADLERVFEPFYTTKESGSGLGLPVCRRVVEAHGGRLTVESVPGRGTTVRLRLPLHA